MWSGGELRLSCVEWRRAKAVLLCGELRLCCCAEWRRAKARLLCGELRQCYDVET